MAANHQIYLAIGSNISPRKKVIHEALLSIKAAFPLHFASSSLYLTKPFLNGSQPVYYNCCVGFLAQMMPQELLAFSGDLEKKLGRKRGINRWESRTIDIDIVLFGDEIIRQPNLVIPHYDLTNRDFFILPLLELDQTLCHPVTGSKLLYHLEEIPEEKRTTPLKLFYPEVLN